MTLTMKGVHLILLSATVMAAAGQVLFKLGATGRQSLQDMLNPTVAAGLAAYGVGTVAWIYALSRLPLRVVYPYTALTFVLVYLAAVILLDERLDIRGAAGVACVLVGLYLLTGSRGA